MEQKADNISKIGICLIYAAAPFISISPGLPFSGALVVSGYVCAAA
jgi:hypothetical protein